MESIIKDGYADVSNLLDTDDMWFGTNDDFFDNDNISQPYIVNVPDSGVIGGLPTSIGFNGDLYSTEGYKRNSKDVKNPYNIIRSGNITMKDVDFPVLGVDNLGNSRVMFPENDYLFKGDRVLEIPMNKNLFINNNY